jgi:hypothetical protein
VNDQLFSWRRAELEAKQQQAPAETAAPKVLE